jgi:hypothetical protein
MFKQSHKKIFFYSESSGALESAARLYKKAAQGGIQDSHEELEELVTKSNEE